MSFLRINRRRKVELIPVAIVLLLSSLISCQQTPNEPDIPIIRRPNWWNFYQRGVTYSLNQEWDKAVSDFQIALGLEKGAIYPEFADQRRVKTYGINFVDDYFPIGLRI